MRGAIIFAAAAIWLAACSNETGPSGTANGASDADNVLHGDDETNIDVWLERLEVGSRELYSARENVVAAIGLKEGDIVADVGAGTGLYTLLFSEAVGETGHVFAVDIEPLFLDLINRRAEDLGYNNITAVLGRENAITLPTNSVDVVYIADTYHYFTDREAIMKTIYDTLKPGGRLIMVEFDIVPGEPKPDYKSHVRFGKSAVKSEVEFIGFKLDADEKVDGLDENYFLQFVKPPAGN